MTTTTELQLEAVRQAREGSFKGDQPLPFKPKCCDCGQAFRFGPEGNVCTMAGARETQITGMCEACFDALFEDEE